MFRRAIESPAMRSRAFPHLSTWWAAVRVRRKAVRVRRASESIGCIAGSFSVYQERKNMNVYLLAADANHYQNLALAREENWQRLLDWFDGNPIGSSWRPVAVHVLRDDRANRDLPPSDFPALSAGIPVFSGRALRALEDLLGENGEILPLTSEDGNYSAYNVTRLIDALDEQHSQLKQFRDGSIMDIVDHQFRPERLVGATVFKLPQVARMQVYVTDDFVSRVKAAGLSGFDFRRVWSGPSSGREGM